MATEVIIAATQAGGSAIIDIKNEAMIKIGTGGLLASVDVTVEEWTGVVYQQAVKGAVNTVLNSDQTSGFLEGPGKYQITLPVTAADAHVYMAFSPAARFTVA